MLRIVAPIFLALISLPAFATENKTIESIVSSPATSCSENYYRELEDMYNCAQKPNLPPFHERLYVGRCFTQTCTDTPIAGALLLRKNEDKDRDAGPIGKTCENLEASSVWAPSKAPNYYDHMTFEDLEHRVDFHAVTDGHASWAFRSSTHTISYLRANDRYLIEKLMDDRDGTFAYCYYFKAAAEEDRAPVEKKCENDDCKRGTGHDERGGNVDHSRPALKDGAKEIKF